jgi:hypothetical protein
MQRLMNVERRPDTDPDVVRLVARQQAISTERNRRIEVARNALIPDGEDVGYADLRAGDTVVVPFITDRGPEIATITSVDGNHVRVRYDDGTERSYMMVGNLTSARWRRGKVGGTEVVTTRDLNVGDRLMLDDGHTARIDVIGDGFNGRILLEVTDDTGQAREIEADRYGSHIRVTTEEVDPAANRPDVADMSDDDLFAEAVENTRAGADTSPGHPLSARQQAIYAEQMRRVKVALLTRPVQVAQVTDATARPRLYTYQRKNLVALGLDTPEAGAPPEVQQAAARVRARQPLTAAQSAALADYVRAIAGNPDTRVQRQRSLNRLAAAFDTSAAVAAGRRADAPQPGNDRVQRVKGTGLTAGDTAVIRGADGKLATVRVRETQTMMRGTLARVTIEHDDGTTETRILDRDADVWLMPDLPPDKPAPVEELPGIELVYAEDLRVGDTMSYMRGGQYLEGQIASISVHSSDGSITFTMADDRQTPISMPSEMRSRIARGPESADQPYLYSVKLSAQPETISGLDVQPGDRVEMNIFDPPARGTVLSIEEATGEDGTTGRYVTFADDTGAIMTAMLFESMHVTRFAKGADNAAETIRQMMDARRAREAENSVVQSLDHIQSRSMARLASSAYDIAAGSGRDAVIRHIEGEIADGGYVAQTEVNNLMANLDVDNRAAVRNLAQQLAADSYQRLLRSVREAEPIGDEAEHQMMQRVLLQHVSHPTLRHNREIARSLLRSIGALSETQNVERITPAVAEGDLPTRMESYRQALGGRFGHVNTRRATYGTVDFNALERGEEPPVTYEDKFVRDTDARDGGPGETAMNHLEIVRAAGADIDANLQQRIADRMTRDGVDLPPEAQGNVSAYMQQLEDLSKELGTARAAAYQRRLYSSTREERAAGLEEWTRIQAEQDELLGRLGRLRQQFATAQRQAATDILSGLRQIGGVRLDYQDADPTRGRGRYRGSGAGHDLGERDQNVRAMRTAEDVLPTDWLNSIRSHVRTAYGRTRIGLGTLRRGHADYRGNIRLSEVGGPFFDGDPGRGQVAVHELSHFAERAVPGMLAAEEAFLWSRTSSGQVGSREREAMVNMDGIGGDSTQFGFTDDFRKPYTGVDYQRSRGRTTQAFEVLTTGVESLFAGSQYMDDDMRAWLLGALALL